MKFYFEGGPLDGKQRSTLGIIPAAKVFVYRRDTQTGISADEANIGVMWNGSLPEQALAVYERNATNDHYKYVPRAGLDYPPPLPPEMDLMPELLERLLGQFPDAEYVPAHMQHRKRVAAYRDLDKHCDNMAGLAYILTERVRWLVFENNIWLSIVVFKNAEGKSSYIFPAEWPDRPNGNNLRGLYSSA